MRPEQLAQQMNDTTPAPVLWRDVVSYMQTNWCPGETYSHSWDHPITRETVQELVELARRYGWRVRWCYFKPKYRSRTHTQIDVRAKADCRWWEFWWWGK